MWRQARIAIVWSLFLYSCTATPPKVQYYVLEPASTTAAPEKIAEPLVAIGPIDLADYLKQPSLAMRQHAHQVTLAQYHVWAENLGQALSRVLVNDLNQQVTSYRFETRADQNGSLPALQLKLRVDQFYPTDQHQVVLAGQYWISDTHQFRVRRSFRLTDDLQQDGYPHAVGKMRQLVSQLAGHISEALMPVN